MRESVWWVAVVVITAASVPTAWWATDRLEAENDFCNECHLPSGTPLHTTIRDDFDRYPPASLASRHAEVRVHDRAEAPDFRCIDCHGGVGLFGRARIKLLSMKDTVLYLAARFEEPDGMTWPIRDAGCRRCHSSFVAKRRGFDGEAFHDRAGHNSDLGVACVDCHAAHTAKGRPDLWFLQPERVRQRCALCHVEYQDRGGGANGS